MEGEMRGRRKWILLILIINIIQTVRGEEDVGDVVKKKLEESFVKFGREGLSIVSTMAKKGKNGRLDFAD